MKLSPPLTIISLVAASFAWMAWEYEPVYHGHGYWICEADGLPADINGKPRQCPQISRAPNVPVIKTLYFNPVKYERKFKTICVDAKNTAKEVPCSFPKARECVNLKGEAVYCHDEQTLAGKTTP